MVEARESRIRGLQPLVGLASGWKVNKSKPVYVRQDRTRELSYERTREILPVLNSRKNSDSLSRYLGTGRKRDESSDGPTSKEYVTSRTKLVPLSSKKNTGGIGKFNEEILKRIAERVKRTGGQEEAIIEQQKELSSIKHSVLSAQLAISELKHKKSTSRLGIGSYDLFKGSRDVKLDRLDKLNKQIKASKERTARIVLNAISEDELVKLEVELQSELSMQARLTRELEAIQIVSQSENRERELSKPFTKSVKYISHTLTNSKMLERVKEAGGTLSTKKINFLAGKHEEAEAERTIEGSDPTIIATSSRKNSYSPGNSPVLNKANKASRHLDPVRITSKGHLDRLPALEKASYRSRYYSRDWKPVEPLRVSLDSRNNSQVGRKSSIRLNPNQTWKFRSQPHTPKRKRNYSSVEEHKLELFEGEATSMELPISPQVSNLNQNSFNRQITAGSHLSTEKLTTIEIKGGKVKPALPNNNPEGSALFAIPERLSSSIRNSSVDGKKIDSSLVNSIRQVDTNTGEKKTPQLHQVQQGICLKEQFSKKIVKHRRSANHNDLSYQVKNSFENLSRSGSKHQSHRKIINQVVQDKPEEVKRTSIMLNGQSINGHHQKSKPDLSDLDNADDQSLFDFWKHNPANANNDKSEIGTYDNQIGSSMRLLGFNRDNKRNDTSLISKGVTLQTTPPQKIASFGLNAKGTLTSSQQMISNESKEEIFDFNGLKGENKKDSINGMDSSDQAVDRLEMSNSNQRSITSVMKEVVFGKNSQEDDDDFQNYSNMDMVGKIEPFSERKINGPRPEWKSNLSSLHVIPDFTDHEN